MGSIAENLTDVKNKIPHEVTLVAVSKTKPNEAIQEAYDAGQRDFGENKVQELAKKAEELPGDIKWHMIGHLQRNKVKYIAPFVHLIHAVDTIRLLEEINKQAAKHKRVINCLLQVHIAEEKEKFGFSEDEVLALLLQEDYLQSLPHISIIGLMGMATNTADEVQIRNEFKKLSKFKQELQNQTKLGLHELSMGMSGDFPIAISCGSTMVRVGSSIFGTRNYH